MSLTTKRNPANRIGLCEQLEIHYTYSVIAVPNEKRKGWSNLLKLRLYSTALKKNIGKEKRTLYQFQMKQVKKLDYETKPERRPPTIATLFDAVVQLLSENDKLCESFSNDKKVAALAKKGTPFTISQNELAVHWICKQNAICKKYSKTTEEELEYRRSMTQVLLVMGDFKLDSFISDINIEEFAYGLRSTISGIINGECNKILAESLHGSRIRTKATKESVADDEITARMHDYAKMLGNVIREYLIYAKREGLIGEDVKQGEIDKALRIYSAAFIVRTRHAAVLGKNLRKKTLSIQDYHELWQKLNHGAESTDIELAELLMLFTGLSAQEVCALDFSDIRRISGYPPRAVYVQVTKKCMLVKEQVVVSDDLGEPSRYRNVPIPGHLYFLLKDCDKILSKRKDKGQDCSSLPLFVDSKTGNRLDFQILLSSFRELFEDGKSNTKLKYIKASGTKDRIDISFQPGSYIVSCKHFWRFFCGLQENEVRYLSGMAQIDTAGQHYIDFNNSHKQYSMRMQMSYGLMAVAADSTIAKPIFRMPVPSKNDPTIKREFSGVFGYVRHTRLAVVRPCTLTLESEHGIAIQKRGE